MRKSTLAMIGAVLLGAGGVIVGGLLGGEDVRDFDASKPVRSARINGLCPATLAEGETTIQGPGYCVISTREDEALASEVEEIPANTGRSFVNCPTKDGKKWEPKWTKSSEIAVGCDVILKDAMFPDISFDGNIQIAQALCDYCCAGAESCPIQPGASGACPRCKHSVEGCTKFCGGK